jgi:hypothetical protein
VCVGLDTATLSPPTLRNDAKFADTVYMADCISLTSRPKQVTIWDSWFGTGGDVADDARHAHFGRRAQPSAIQPVRQAALPNRFERQWYPPTR